jgi:CrcB protein
MDLTVLWVALGSAVGGAGRYGVSSLMARQVGEGFPWGTLTVNIVGSLLITFIATLTGPDGRLMANPAVRQFLLVGVLGGFTTFSSFSIQTLVLAQDGEWGKAAGNVLASVALCLLGAWIGHVLATAINR